ncbi:MAG: hypothetical protein QXX19_02595 [Candidatus Caldarchaeum sp.]
MVGALSEGWDGYVFVVDSRPTVFESVGRPDRSVQAGKPVMDIP